MRAVPAILLLLASSSALSAAPPVDALIPDCQEEFLVPRGPVAAVTTLCGVRATGRCAAAAKVALIGKPLAGTPQELAVAVGAPIKYAHTIRFVPGGAYVYFALGTFRYGSPIRFYTFENGRWQHQHSCALAVPVPTT